MESNKPLINRWAKYNPMCAGCIYYTISFTCTSPNPSHPDTFGSKVGCRVMRSEADAQAWLNAIAEDNPYKS